MPTLDEWFAKYFAPEYCNVQNPAAWKDQAKTELQAILNLQPTKPAA